MSNRSVLIFVRHGTEYLFTASSDGGGPLSVPKVPVEGDRSPMAVAREFGDALTPEGSFGVRDHGMTLTTTDDEIVPVLLEVPSTQVDPEPLDGDPEWHTPDVILSDLADGHLWAAYEEIAPTIRSIAADTDHGSTYLSIRALEIIRDRAAWQVHRGEDDLDALRAHADELMSVRPSMVALKVRVAQVIEGVDSSETLLDRTIDVLDRASQADRAAASAAAEVVGTDAVVFVFSRSETVMDAIDVIDPHQVVTTVAEPGGEGVSVAEALVEDVDVVLGPDAAMADLLADAVDVVLLGADAIDGEGAVLNKLGSHTLARTATSLDIPVYVVSATAKATSTGHGPPERLSRGEVYKGDHPIDVRAYRFDRTPPSLIAGYCTEEGIIDKARITTIADDNGSLLD